MVVDPSGLIFINSTAGTVRGKRLYRNLQLLRLVGYIAKIVLFLRCECFVVREDRFRAAYTDTFFSALGKAK